MQTAQIDGTCDTSHQTIRAGDWLVREVATSLDQPPSAKANHNGFNRLGFKAG
jgi:hypothetical protein